MKENDLQKAIRQLAHENGKPFKKLQSRFNEMRDMLEKSNPGQHYSLYELEALKLMRQIYNVKRCE